MGYGADRGAALGIYYLATRAQAPFCGMSHMYVAAHNRVVQKKKNNLHFILSRADHCSFETKSYSFSVAYLVLSWNRRQVPRRISENFRYSDATIYFNCGVAEEMPGTTGKFIEKKNTSFIDFDPIFVGDPLRAAVITSEDAPRTSGTLFLKINHSNSTTTFAIRCEWVFQISSLSIAWPSNNRANATNNVDNYKKNSKVEREERGANDILSHSRSRVQSNHRDSTNDQRQHLVSRGCYGSRGSFIRGRFRASYANNPAG